ncbi:MAG: glycosyltransferase [Gemmatimonadales bacterium]|nr:MAG: glycosyltransferase [Gemmatimonadales bacterium]
MKATTGAPAEGANRPSEGGDPSPRPLSVVHLCTPARVGGLERVVQGLAVWTARAGHQVTVMAVSGPGADLGEFLAPLERAQVPVVRVESSGRRYLAERRVVQKHLRRMRPDVLHTHGYRCDLLHGGPARRLGIATVSTLHGSSRMGGLSHLFEWLQERALARFDGVVAVSEPLRQSLLTKGVRADRVHLIPNGWVPPERYLDREEARRELKLPQDRLIIGWIGRLIPIKGCDVFLEALTRLGPNAPPWHGIVVGDGPERAALEEQARHLGIEDRVTFAGSVPEAARIARALDLFVLSSRSEGTPMTILEIMGAGVPVVATAVGGVPEVVAAPRGGWVVPPEEPEELAEVIEEVLADRQKRGLRGGAGQERTNRVYGPVPWVQLHINLYGTLIPFSTSRSETTPITSPDDT